MIVLDTNIVSEQTKPYPDETVLGWMNAQHATQLRITTPTIAELSMGANQTILRSGSRKYELLLNVLLGEYADRILLFDPVAAEAYGRLVARRRHSGRPILVIDAMIAAICIAHGATLATRNIRDFDGLDLKLVNPFEPVI